MVQRTLARSARRTIRQRALRTQLISNSRQAKSRRSSAIIARLSLQNAVPFALTPFFAQPTKRGKGVRAEAALVRYRSRLAQAAYRTLALRYRLARRYRLRQQLQKRPVRRLLALRERLRLLAMFSGNKMLQRYTRTQRRRARQLLRPNKSARVERRRRLRLRGRAHRQRHRSMMAKPPLRRRKSQRRAALERRTAPLLRAVTKVRFDPLVFNRVHNYVAPAENRFVIDGVMVDMPEYKKQSIKLTGDYAQAVTTTIRRMVKARMKKLLRRRRTSRSRCKRNLPSVRHTRNHPYKQLHRLQRKFRYNFLLHYNMQNSGLSSRKFFDGMYRPGIPLTEALFRHYVAVRHNLALPKFR